LGEGRGGLVGCRLVIFHIQSLLFLIRFLNPPFRYLEIYHVEGDAFENFKARMNAPPGSRPRPLAEVVDDSWSGSYSGPAAPGNYADYSNRWALDKVLR
jgi:hypothetical protein